jgi:hypothetical protein
MSNSAAGASAETRPASGPARSPCTGTRPQFLRSPAGAILACGFLTAGLPGGTRAHVLAVTEHPARRIRILGVTLHPAGQRTAQQARNLVMDPGEQASQVTFMIRDREPDFTAALDAVLAGAGIRTMLGNVQAPRMNAITERRTGGCRRELPDRTRIRNQAHLRRILHDYETQPPPGGSSPAPCAPARSPPRSPPTALRPIRGSSTS